MKTIKLKKYANRKIYAGKNGGLIESGYVNHRDIAELIKQGNTIEVTDDKTGEDVTNTVLLEVVKQVGNLTNEFLYGTIRG